MKANASSNISKPETIENYIMECLKEFPKYYDVYLYWAKVKIKMNELTDAIEIYTEAIQINPSNSEAYK
jgi:tetratricopeptide (TPR) repeat protein